MYVYLIFLSQQHGFFSQNKAIKIGTAEKKILMALSYYVLVTVFSLMSFTLTTRNSGPFVMQLQAYFACEGRGRDPDNPCDRNNFQQLAYPGVATTSNVLLGLFPAVNLLYVLNIRELKDKCIMCS